MSRWAEKESLGGLERNLIQLSQGRLFVRADLLPKQRLVLPNSIVYLERVTFFNYTNWLRVTFSTTCLSSFCHLAIIVHYNV